MKALAGFFGGGKRRSGDAKSKAGSDGRRSQDSAGSGARRGEDDAARERPTPLKDFSRGKQPTGGKMSGDSAYVSERNASGSTSMQRSAVTSLSSSPGPVGSDAGGGKGMNHTASFDTARLRSSTNHSSGSSTSGGTGVEASSSADSLETVPTNAARRSLHAQGGASSRPSGERLREQLPPLPSGGGGGGGGGEGKGRLSQESGRTEESSGHSRRSSFALERASFESNRASLDRFRRQAEQPGQPLPADRLQDPLALCRALSVPQSMVPRFLALAVVPVDTPLPMSMLRRLWGLATAADAEATANLLAQLGVMKVACLADDSAWALVQPAYLKALHETAAKDMRAPHADLLDAYLASEAGGGGPACLADVSDDGYIMQNAGHHAVHARRLGELRGLLTRPAWLEAKLHSYGVASVVADFRRYLMVEPSDSIKLLLEAFQMSVSACLAHPAVPMLHAQLAGRLMLSRSMSAKVQLDARPVRSGRSRRGSPLCLRTRTPSLEQAGGLQRMTLRGHTDAIRKVLLTPGGADIVTSSADGTARVWDMEIGDCVLLLEGHEAPLTDAAMAADGSIIVTASEDGTARAWDLEQGQCLNVLVGHTGAVNSVAVDRHGKIAVTGGADGTGRVWDLRRGACVQLLLGHTSLGSLHRVILSRDSSRAITCSADFSARCWEVFSGACSHVFQGHTGWVVDAVLAADGSLLVTASHDGTARAWDMLSGRCVHVLRGHTGRVNAVRVAADGRTVVTAADDFTARVFDLQTGACRHTLVGHAGWVSDCAITASSNAAITTSGDDLAVVWDLAAGSCTNVLEGHSGEVLSVVLTRRARFAVTGSADATARVWDLAAGSAHLQRAHSGRVHGLVATPDQSTVISYGDDGCLVWDVAGATCSASLEGPAVRWACCLANGRHVLCASGDRTTQLWDLSASSATTALAGNRGSRVKSWAASLDGRVAVVVLFDSTVTVWDLHRQEPLTVLQRWGQRDAAIGHTGGVNAACVSSDGAHVLTVAKDCTGRIWDVASGTCLHVLQGHTDGVTGCVISADDRLAATLAYDNTARLWDMRTGACLGLMPHASAVSRAAFSADASLLLTAVADHTAMLWALEPGAPPRFLHILRGHTEEVMGIALSADCRWAATCSRDNSLQLWHCDTGRLEGFFASDAGLTCCHFAGSSLFAGDDTGILHLLELPPSQAAA